MAAAIFSEANRPASIRLARSTSSSAVSSGTLPISLRYMRTGSEVGALSASSSSSRRRRASRSASSASSPPASRISMPSSLRTCRTASVCSGGSSAACNATVTSSVVRKPISLPLVMRSLTSSTWASRGRTAGLLMGGISSLPSRDRPRLRGTQAPFPELALVLFQGDQLTICVLERLGVGHGVEPLHTRLQLRDTTGHMQLLYT